MLVLNWMLISHKLVHKHTKNSICLIVFFLCLATLPLLKLTSNCTFIIFTNCIFFLLVPLPNIFRVYMLFYRPDVEILGQISCNPLLHCGKKFPVWLWELQEVPHILTLFVGPCEMILIPSETIPRRSASWKRAWQQRPVDVTLSRSTGIGFDSEFLPGCFLYCVGF